MNERDDAARRLEEYLSELRANLRRLPAPEVSEIVRELRGHVLESAGSTGTPPSEQGVASVLERLGAPAQLASLYSTECVWARAAGAASPWLAVRATLRVATLGVAGAFAALGLVAGAVLSSSFFLAALRKPFAPDRAGLWRLTDGSFSLRLGFGGLEPGQELLGWWIVPLGLLLGAGMVWLALQLARLCIRYRRRAPLQAL
jgi:hypothetical protein